MNKEERIEWMKSLADNLRIWRGWHIVGSDLTALDDVISEVQHYIDVDSGLCKLDLDKYDLVCLGNELDFLDGGNTA